MDPLPVHHTCKGIQPNWETTESGLGIIPWWYPVVMSSFSARMALSTSSWHTQLRQKGHIFRNLNLGTCIAKWIEMVLMKNIHIFEKLPTNGFVHCTRLASSYLDDLVFFPSKHQPLMALLLPSSRQGRSTFCHTLNCRHSLAVVKQRGVLPNRPKTSHHESPMAGPMALPRQKTWG